MVTVGVTGHRQFLHSSLSIRQNAKQRLVELEATEVITGMALGFDQLIAEVCIELDIPFIAAIPCKDQEKLWTKPQQDHYHELLLKAGAIVMVDDGEYAPWKMMKRNQYIVDRAAVMLAYWTGAKQGGTAQCLRYAKNRKTKVEFIKFLPNQPLLKTLYI